MRKLLLFVLLTLFIIWPNTAFASSFNMNLHFLRQEDGTASGELWYNDRIIWRLEFLCDGARPALSTPGVNTTSIMPDIVDGLFIIKVK